MKRCRDCKYWVTRKGCVHPLRLVRTGAVALGMDKSSVYKHTLCDYFTEKNKEH